MSMPIDVYRSAARGGYDCTNGGVSSRFTRLTVVNVEGPFEPDADAPAVVLEQHVRGCLRLAPVDAVYERGAIMFGGNYGHTSDSRFARKCEALLGHRFYGAVAIHDRIEA
jgi:hypothetical protein